MDDSTISPASRGASADDQPGLPGSGPDLPGDVLAKVLRQLDCSDSIAAVNIATDGAFPIKHDNRGDLVAALPPELVAEIFRQLDFDGRLAVSHVCKAWRQAALLDRVLWSEYNVPQRGAPSVRIPRAIEEMTALLSRSSPLPFRLYCKRGVTRAIVNVVLENIDRMELLHFGVLQTTDRERLLALDAPLLKHFVCEGSADVSATIPAGWALHIEYLEINIPCVWPSGCVFRHLRSFSGSMLQGHGFGAPISQCFPSLRSLNLSDVTQALIESMVPLPSSLTVLKLETLDDVDCAELLGNCAARDLRELEIYSTGTGPSALEALRLFTRTVSSSWRMQVVGTAMSLWALPYHYVVYCSAPQWLSRERGISSCWDRLGELLLPIADFEQLMATISAGNVLPMLSSLALTIARGYRPDPVTAESNATRVDAPILRTVQLFVEPTFESLVDVPRMILRMVRAPVPLALLVVCHDPSNKPDTTRVSELRGLVGRVELRDFGTTVYYTFRL